MSADAALLIWTCKTLRDANNKLILQSTCGGLPAHAAFSFTVSDKLLFTVGKGQIFILPAGNISHWRYTLIHTGTHWYILVHTGTHWRRCSVETGLLFRWPVSHWVRLTHLTLSESYLWLSTSTFFHLWVFMFFFLATFSQTQWSSWTAWTLPAGGAVGVGETELYGR